MVTIKDVAREAKVSVATVSRVLNGSGVVREETGRRIREVATRLRFIPHGGARSLSTSKTDTLGVLLPDLYGDFFSEVIRGMDETAQGNGFQLLLSSSHAHKHGIEAAMRAMRGRVDGVVAMSPGLDSESLSNIPASLPLLLLCSGTSGPAHSLNIENCSGARAMVRHLIASGHSSVAIIKGAVGNYDAAERLRGYRLALKDAGIQPRAALERDGHFTETGGYAAALELLGQTPRPTAIFAANDSMAIGALSAIRESGLDVPGDIAVAGFDDIPLARYVDPPLSTVRVPICELGARAITMLLSSIADKNNGHSRMRGRVSTELKIRDSCGAVPSERPPPADLHPQPVQSLEVQRSNTHAMANNNRRSK